MMPDKNCSALILAAGKGTRMKSSVPKVMQPLLEEPMIYYVLQSLTRAGIKDIAVVVGHKGEYVQSWLAENAPGVQVVWQREQLGTGHAVMSAREWIRERRNVLILNGDMPMLTENEICQLLTRSGNCDVAFMTCDLDEPAQYGRVVRKNDGIFIVEAKDASQEELLIKEINAGVYFFKSKVLLEGLQNLRADNKQKEYYIVDLISWAGTRGYQVLPVKLPSDNLKGVNTPLELAQLSKRMRDRILSHWLLEGVKCVDADSVWISPRAVFHGEATLYPNVQIWGKSEIGSGCVIASGTILRDVVLKENVHCIGYVVANNIIAEKGVKIGPFCFLRDNTHLLENSFAGKFVEIKNSEIGEGTKVPHLSYIGDTVIGQETNIGAASVTCNYDGINKNHTQIGSHCFIGSDTMFVAPVKVGDNAVVGAGSVITQNVPEGALAVARGRQVIVEGWAQKKKQKSEKNK
jgi:bifunctional UDP-N-acetylglucosamine pyrophosphorylase/glucosamine-1-phosphate N-acetyltransferase